MRVFKSLLEVSTKHRYYEDLVCSDLEFTPTGSTLSFINKHRLILKKKADGFHIIRQYREVGGKMTPFVDMTTPFSLKFNVFINNKFFLNITNLEFFDSRVKNMHIVHKLQKEKKEDQKLVTNSSLCPVYYSTMQVSECNQEIKILDAGGSVVFESTDLGNQEVVNIGLGGFEFGIYQLIMDNQPPMNFIFNESFPIQSAGILEVIFDPDDLEFTDYKLDIIFNFRKVYWKYIIQKKYNDLEKLQVVDEKGEYLFNETGGEGEALGIKKEFVSDREISLLQRNNLIFKVIRRNERQNNERVLIEKLPYPDIHNIGIESGEIGGKVFTSIFVLV
jgi:hypothetical protein